MCGTHNAPSTAVTSSCPGPSLQHMHAYCHHLKCPAGRSADCTATGAFLLLVMRAHVASVARLHCCAVSSASTHATTATHPAQSPT